MQGPWPALLLLLCLLWAQANCAKHQRLPRVARTPRAGRQRGAQEVATPAAPALPSLQLRCDALQAKPSFLRWRMTVGHLLGGSAANTSTEDPQEDWVPEAPGKDVKQVKALPVADELPECGVLSFKSPFHGVFTREADTGAVRFQLKQCRVRRLTPHQALGCLSSKHIVLVGDSMTRFQYISLAHFLARGRMHRVDDGSDGLSFVAPSLLPTPATKAGRAVGPGGGGMTRAEIPFKLLTGQKKLIMKRPKASRAAAAAAPPPDPWDSFYAATKQALSRPGCVNVTCSCYRNLEDHAPGQDPLSRVHEYWRVRMQLEDDSRLLLSMGLVYAYPDFVTAGINGLRWAFSQAKEDPPDLLLFNMGVWWGYVHSGRKADVSMSQVLTAFEQIFKWGQSHVKEKGLHTRLVYKTSVPITGDSRLMRDSYWWKVWPTKIEPLLITMARALGWEVFDARELITTARKQGVSTHRDATHLHPFMLEQLNDVLLGSTCSRQGWVGLSPAEHMARLG